MFLLAAYKLLYTHKHTHTHTHTHKDVNLTEKKKCPLLILKFGSNYWGSHNWMVKECKSQKTVAAVLDKPSQGLLKKDAQHTVQGGQ